MWQRGAALMAAIAVGLLMALTGTASADGSHEDQKCAEGEAKGDGTTVTPGGVPFATFKFTVCRNGPDTHDVSGYFAGAASLSGGAIAPQGPVTCADFDEDTVSFLYPLNDKSEPPAIRGMEILIVATDGGPSPADDKVGNAGPLPPAAFGGNCDLTSPQATFAKANALPLGEGQVTVRS